MASPHVINRIRTTQGKRLVYARADESPSRVIDSRAVAMMNTMMQETLQSGTARKAELPGWSAAGKTGTSQDFRDAWFIGYTSTLITGVWLGNDDNSPTKKATGGGLPVEVWTRFMRVALQGQSPQPLPGGSMAGPATIAQANPRGETTVVNVPATSVANARPQPARASNARPEPSAGLDGWLVDRLFGR
jgi:penicillin-binding protein 1A